jgi:hypothetical protein
LGELILYLKALRFLKLIFSRMHNVLTLESRFLLKKKIDPNCSPFGLLLLQKKIHFNFIDLDLNSLQHYSHSDFRNSQKHIKVEVKDLQYLLGLKA